MGQTYSLEPRLDIAVQIFHDLYPMKRKRFRTICLLTDDPGITEPTLTSSMAEVSELVASGTRTHVACNDAFRQYPHPREILLLPVKRTTGFPATDWDNTLDDHIENVGLDFYRIAAVSRKPTVQTVLNAWASTMEVEYGTSNYAGAQAKRDIGADASKVTIQALWEGLKGNTVEVEFVKQTTHGLATDVVVVALLDDAGYKITVKLEVDTDDTTIIAKAEDVVLAINAHPDATAHVRAYDKNGDLTGAAGTGTVGIAELAFLTGGGTDKDTVSSFATRRTTFHNMTTTFWLWKDPATGDNDRFLEMGAWGMGATRNNGSFTYAKRMVQGFADPNWTTTERKNIRQAYMNSIFTESETELLGFSDGYTTDGLYADIVEAIHVTQAWQRETLWDLEFQPPGGRGKIPYSQPGFDMIEGRLYGTLDKGALPEWNFIQVDPKTGYSASRVYCPTYLQVLKTDPGLIKGRHYDCSWEATYNGAIESIGVNGYLTVEWITPSRVAFAAAG